MKVFALCAVSLALYACGSSATDKQCAALCDNSSGSGNEVCSDASVSKCATSCVARVDGVSAICSTCLLENAHLVGTTSIPNASCSANFCTLTNPNTGQSCTFVQNNAASQKSCVDMLYPPKSEECDVSYDKPVTDCASVCQAK
jgi:hypothetical protein